MLGNPPNICKKCQELEESFKDCLTCEATDNPQGAFVEVGWSKDASQYYGAFGQKHEYKYVMCTEDGGEALVAVE